MNRLKIINILFLILIVSCLFFSNSVLGCKDIIATGDATAGDFNLLMKVRDPSRPGLQVLCIVPEGYQYTYHHPWTGKAMTFTTEKKYIGVASENDIIPNIVKAGMTLTEAGLAFGDADTNSGWKNPTKYAWDDFDWIRYACEKADNEEEAISLLTKDLVDEMHATGVSENLFIIGPKTGFVIEADAFRYDIKEITDDVAAYSNYPKELWKTQLHNLRTIAPSFDFTKEKTIRKGGTIRLNSIRGIRVLDIKSESIIAKQVPFFKTYNKEIILMDDKVEIKLGERKKVGDFSVELLDMDNNKATLKVCNIFKAWENKIMGIIKPNIGSINIEDMIKWSRLHKEDLDGLRGMCQKVVTFETVAIYKVPEKNYDILSMGWYSPNHACSSIYVPFHICNNDIEDTYTTPEAANLCLELLYEYGPGGLSENFTKVEGVFIKEIDNIENLAIDLINKNKYVSDILTAVDMGMQRQAYYTEELWLIANKNSNKEEIQNIIQEIWETNYSKSLEQMKLSFSKLKEKDIDKIVYIKIAEIGLDICKTKIDIIALIGKNTSFLMEEFEQGAQQINQEKYSNGFETLIKTYKDCELIMQGKSPISKNKEELNGKFENINLIIIIFLIILILLIILIKKNYKN